MLLSYILSSAFVSKGCTKKIQNKTSIIAGESVLHWKRWLHKLRHLMRGIEESFTKNLCFYWFIKRQRNQRQWILPITQIHSNINQTQNVFSNVYKCLVTISNLLSLQISIFFEIINFMSYLNQCSGPPLSNSS